MLQQVRYLGVVRANPLDYVQRYGASVRDVTSLPDYVLTIPTPKDVGVLAAERQRGRDHELEGSLEAQLLGRGIRDLGASESVTASIQESENASEDSSGDR